MNQDTKQFNKFTPNGLTCPRYMQKVGSVFFFTNGPGEDYIFATTNFIDTYKFKDDSGIDNITLFKLINGSLFMRVATDDKEHGKIYKFSKEYTGKVFDKLYSGKDFIII